MEIRQRGFTLLEMSITLLIVGILLTGLIMTLSAQQDATREAETRRQLAQAREALYGFAMVNGRLPCPADPTLPSGAANAGRARAFTPAGCTGGQAGVLPWSELGLAETDPYGNRITYRVTAEFSRSTPALTLTSAGDNVVQSTLGTNPPLASALPAVLVSHGPNGVGAWSSSGVQSLPAAGDEAENSDGNTTFRYGPRRDDFDDEVEWIVPSILMHRMVQAGRLP